jgi:hypothetical protein
MLAPFRIKLRPYSLGAGSLGQVGRPVSGTSLRVLQDNGVGLSLSDVPPGCPKGIRSDHHWFLETRKGVPTNWAGTPDAAHLELPASFAKPLFATIPAKK